MGKLHRAVGKKNNLAEVKKIVEENHSIRVDGLNKAKYSPIEIAVALGSLDVVQYLIEEKKVSLKKYPHADKNLMEYAVDNDDISILSYLADPEKKRYLQFEDGTTDLHAAALLGRYDEVVSILERDPKSINTKNASQNSPLSLAIKGRHHDLMNYLLAQKAEVGDDDKRLTIAVVDTFDPLVMEKVFAEKLPARVSVLYYICSTMVNDEKRNEKQLKLAEMAKIVIGKMREQGDSDFNRTIEGDEYYPGVVTPFYAAIDQDNVPLVKVFIQEGINPRTLLTGEHAGWHPIFMAAGVGSFNVFRYLVEEVGMECDKAMELDVLKQGVSNTPIALACRGGHLPIVKYLLTKAPTEKNKLMVLAMACLFGQNGIIDFCLEEEKMDVNVVFDSTGWMLGLTPFLVACVGQHTETLAHLVGKGVDPKAPMKIGNLKGLMPIHFAAGYGYARPVDFLIADCGIDVNSVCQVNGQSQETPLYIMFNNYEQRQQQLKEQQQPIWKLYTLQALVRHGAALREEEVRELVNGRKYQIFFELCSAYQESCFGKKENSDPLGQYFDANDYTDPSINMHKRIQPLYADLLENMKKCIEKRPLEEKVIGREKHKKLLDAYNKESKLYKERQRIKKEIDTLSDAIERQDNNRGLMRVNKWYPLPTVMLEFKTVAESVAFSEASKRLARTRRSNINIGYNANSNSNSVLVVCDNPGRDFNLLGQMVKEFFLSKEEKTLQTQQAPVVQTPIVSDIPLPSVSVETVSPAVVTSEKREEQKWKKSEKPRRLQANNNHKRSDKSTQRKSSKKTTKVTKTTHPKKPSRNRAIYVQPVQPNRQQIEAFLAETKRQQQATNSTQRKTVPSSSHASDKNDLTEIALKYQPSLRQPEEKPPITIKPSASKQYIETARGDYLQISAILEEYQRCKEENGKNNCLRALNYHLMRYFLILAKSAPHAELPKGLTQEEANNIRNILIHTDFESEIKQQKLLTLARAIQQKCEKYFQLAELHSDREQGDYITESLSFYKEYQPAIAAKVNLGCLKQNTFTDILQEIQFLKKILDGVNKLDNPKYYFNLNHLFSFSAAKMCITRIGEKWNHLAEEVKLGSPFLKVLEQCVAMRNIIGHDFNEVGSNGIYELSDRIIQLEENHSNQQNKNFSNARTLETQGMFSRPHPGRDRSETVKYFKPQQ